MVPLQNVKLNTLAIYAVLLDIKGEEVVYENYSLQVAKAEINKFNNNQTSGEVEKYTTARSNL